jgi:hypothetical protein
VYELLTNPFPARRSIIHGDLHAHNILVGSQGLPYYIDFAKTGPGPTLFDFIKHEVNLWSSSFARWPTGSPHEERTLANALRLMEALTDRNRPFPSPFSVPDCCCQRDWLTRCYQYVSTVRSLAQQHVDSPDARDYFAPLCIYSGLLLRWCDPRSKASPQDQLASAREGLFATLLSAMMLSSGLIEGVTARQRASMG